MNPMPQLEPLLKQLRLPGILDSLEARNRQAIEAKRAYTDFLALLIEDEVIRRDQRQFAQRLRKAQVVGDKTLERFDCSHSPSVNHALIAELATCRFVTEHAPVLIAGATGTGKSHLAQSLGHCALLAVDDFGLRPTRSPKDDDFHDLIDARYERTTTLLTSNMHFDEWGAAFPNKLMGAATLDRLCDRAYQIVLDGETRRKPRPMPEVTSPARATASRDAAKLLIAPR